jgi:GDP-4-dehydro-6-deoxy-D-mannose reductase
LTNTGGASAGESFMRALITGISGFVGSHLAEHLAAAGAEVYGVARQRGGGAEARGDVVLIGDILDENFLRKAVAEARPTHVFHCAAILAGGTEPKLVYETNVIGTSNLLAALRENPAPPPMVIVAGSSAVYGRPSALPVCEEAPFVPITEYAASKIAQEMVALAHFYAYRLPVVRVRTFNLVGPRLPESLVTSSLAKQIAAAEHGGPRTVRVGSLDTRRDYTDVRDAVRAYAMLAERGVPGEAYNVCSGTSRSVRESLDILMKQARVKVDVEIDPARIKPSDIDDQRGSFERLRATTGWQPAIPFEQSLRDLLDAWRSI